ncbi:MAG: hypothetical protein ACLFQA_03215 [Bacteroidales bacterium]
MKKSIFLAGVMIIAFIFPDVFATGSESGSDNNAVIEIRDDKLAESDKAGAIEAEEDILSEEEIKLLEMRIEEIRDMNKSDLTGEEKKDLKNELRDIREQMRKADGIYLSVGALILILILLVILT